MTPGAAPPRPHVGIGLRAPHHAALLAEKPRLDFIEVHSENYFADGGVALARLHQARENYPISLHGVGLGLGSAAGLCEWHLDRLDRLVRRIEPDRVSDHACFARVAVAGGGSPAVHAADLLPIAFNEATLTLMTRHVSQVQERLRRPLLVENLAHSLASVDDTMSEPEFFVRLCATSGCALLLDLNNLMVDALNHPDDGAGEGSRDDRGPALDACQAYLAALPRNIVEEIHLAGYRDSGPFVVDDHGSRVRPAVWTLYQAALRRFGVVPTLVEWDTDLPPLAVLLGEAGQAAALQQGRVEFAA